MTEIAICKVKAREYKPLRKIDCCYSAPCGELEHNHKPTRFKCTAKSGCFSVLVRGSIRPGEAVVYGGLRTTKGTT